MHRARKQLLACAAFAQEKYRRFARGGFFGLVDDAAHGLAVARNQVIAAAQLLREELNILS